MKKIFVAALCATTAMSFAQTTANIDDFEDGDGLANTGGAKDAWYAYTDVNDKGASTYTNTKDQYGLVVVLEEAAAGGSTHGAGLTGISLAKGSNANDPYVVLAVNVAGGLSGCTTISYKYKGAGHNLKATMKGDDSGDLTGYNRHAYALDGSTSWTNASVSVSQLKQAAGWGTTLSLNMANVVSLSWEVKGTATSDYLYIDDVNCAGYTPGASSSTTTPTTAVVIDDFEDGNTTAETLGKTAYWYIYTADGKVTNTQDANDSWDILDSVDGTNHWVTMKGISGITPGSDKLETPVYTSVGMEVAFTSGVLSGCTAIQYDYKGSGHRMRSTVDGVTVNKGWEHVATDQPASTTWKTVTVSSMAQPEWVADATGATVVAFSWAKVSRLTWVVDEKFSAANLGTSLSIDNLKCVGTMGGTTTKPVSSSSTIPASSNSNAANNNNANNNANNNNATNPGMNTAIGVVAAPAGLSATLHGNTLQVSVAKAGLVKVQVFDMMGHAIESHSENMTAGSFAHSFANMSKGAYIIRVQQGSMVKTVRMQVR